MQFMIVVTSAGVFALETLFEQITTSITEAVFCFHPTQITPSYYWRFFSELHKMSPITNQ